MIGKAKGMFSRFPKVFWISMTFELFERGAYYSFTPIIVYHAVYNLGVSEWIGATLFVFIWPIQYGLPILSGALVEKVGYRRQIVLAFCILTFAYFFLSRAINTATLLLAVVAMGFGIGTYKPLISAIVAKVTTSEDRTYAFGIYYWIVNIAAAFFPVGFAFAEWQYWIRPEVYQIIFMVGGILVSFNIIIGLFFFEDIPRSKTVKTVRDALNNVKISLSDKKFMVLVLLIAGFWALYSTQLTGIIIIIYGYRWVPGWFTPIVYAIFNPMTIVLAGPFISKYIEKVESIRVIIAGVLVYLIGLMILGYGAADWRSLVFGIVIMSAGEFMVAPGYYSFTSKLATKDKVSAYIGSTFISTFFGLAMGAFVLGLLVAFVAVELQMPYFFFGILIAFGFLLYIAFILYYQKWGQDVIERAKRIAEEEEGKKAEIIDDGYKEPFIFRLYETKAPILLSLIMIPIILFSTFSLGTFNYIGPEKEEEVRPIFDINNYNVAPGLTADSGGTLAEGQTQTETMEIALAEGEKLKSVTFELTWTDEDDYTRVVRTWENEPDEFELTASFGENVTNRTQGANLHGASQTISVTFEFDYEFDDEIKGAGIWEYSVRLIVAGDLTNPRSPILYTDDSNSYDLTISAEIYQRK
ncbi:MAG: MFS transporter [Thermoplasmata archaeon]|nr:MAG: MFS transporter [Thermoplasmata archaeon]